MQKKSGGFTLVEVVVSTGIILMLGLIVMQVYWLIISQTAYYREQSVVVSLADQYMEIARNLPYSEVGTLSGNPHGNLADSVNPITATVNGTSYQIYYVVNYIDDPADGTVLAGTDAAPNDYKQVKLYVKNVRTSFTNNFLTSIVPLGLEGLASGGALSIKVFNAVGQPVSGATIRIQNSTLNPVIDLTRLSDAGGNWVEVGLPNSASSYHITVTKNGYSFDQTYAPTQYNPNPTKGDATISNGQITQISFSIDLLSNLTFNVQNQTCGPITSVPLNITGSKLIGMPDILKFNNVYFSDSNGQILLNNVEWDTYVPTLNSSTLMIYGTSPTQQATILPGTNATFSLILGPKTTNSLLVIVKDASTSNVIEGANVTLTGSNPSTDISQITGGSMWSQQDWSGGPLTLPGSAGNYASSSTFTSESFDTGTSASSYTTIAWQPTSQNPATTLKFQIAINNDDTTWNFIGPDGTENTYYTVPGTTISAANNNARYIRYKAFLSTTDSTQTPVLTSININYVSGCFTPGQVMFAGLGAGSNYQVAVSAEGYTTQTITGINISGYNTLQVLMSQ